MNFSDRIYRIDRINFHPNPVILSRYTSMRLPKVIADLYHLNTSLKLPIETEPGGIRLKIVKRKMEA